MKLVFVALALPNMLFRNEQELAKTSQFSSDIAKIAEHVLSGPGKGQAFSRLGYLSDTFGHRYASSSGYDKASNWTIEQLLADGFDNVHTEEVEIPKWVRGFEEATLLEPRVHRMSILGCGGTVPTPSGGITADAIVIRSFDELSEQGSRGRIKGKIVVFNQPWTRYGPSVAYRNHGPAEAARYGAIATLVRSPVSHSINSPSTGQTYYDSAYPKIPGATITVEDAEMLDRMQTRGQSIRIKLNIASGTVGTASSRNIIADLTGTTYPNEIVLISGHFDSWDVGTGAMDDGGGVIISWQAIRVLKQLGLRPKRTIRTVFWTAEEIGEYGSKAYYQRHKNNKSENFVFVGESDIGAFPPAGFNFSGSPQAQRIMKEQISPLLTAVNAGNVYPLDDGEDVQSWIAEGVPGVWMENPDYYDYYFQFHHTEGDTMTVFKPGDLDKAAAAWTALAHVVANMEPKLPIGK